MTEDTIDGVSFDGISNFCACAVGLDKASIFGGDACAAINIANKPFLRFTAGICDALNKSATQ